MVYIHIQYLRHKQTNFEGMKLLLTTYLFYWTYNELKLISNSATKGQNGVFHKAMRFGVSRLIKGRVMNHQSPSSKLDVCVPVHTHTHTHTEPRGAAPLPIPAGKVTGYKFSLASESFSP